MKTINEMNRENFDPNIAGGAGRGRRLHPVAGSTRERGARKAVEGPADALDHYVRAIGPTPILSREMTFELARIIEAQNLAFREAMYAIPATARAILDRWHELRRTGHVTAQLAEGYRDKSGVDWSAHVDARLGALEPLIAEREKLAEDARTRRGEIDAEIRAHLFEAEIAFEMVHQVFRGFEVLLEAPTRPEEAELRHRSGLDTPEVWGLLAAARRAVAGRDEAKQTFVRHNLKLVVKLAKRYRNMGVLYLDLIQEGNVGLIRAVEKFDYRRGHMFSTYAVWWINQAMIRVIQNHSRTVRVPSNVYDLQLRYRRAELKLRRRGHEPDAEALAGELGIEIETAERVAATMKPIVSTDAPLLGTDDLKILDTLKDAEAVDPVEDIDRLQVRRELARLMEPLDARDRRILELRYGLCDGEPLTLAGVSELIGLSRERIRQLEARALERLRQAHGVEKLAASLGLVADDAA